MLIPRWLIAMLIVSITMILCSKYGFEYLGIKDTNNSIRFEVCLKQNIKQDICGKIIGVEK